jgi:membrane protein DedA with SNARE-associated domain
MIWWHAFMVFAVPAFCIGGAIGALVGVGWGYEAGKSYGRAMAAVERDYKFWNEREELYRKTRALL